VQIKNESKASKKTCVSKINPFNDSTQLRTSMARFNFLAFTHQQALLRCVDKQHQESATGSSEIQTNKACQQTKVRYYLCIVEMTNELQKGTTPSTVWMEIAERQRVSQFIASSEKIIRRFSMVFNLIKYTSGSGQCKTTPNYSVSS